MYNIYCFDKLIMKESKQMNTKIIAKKLWKSNKFAFCTWSILQMLQNYLWPIFHTLLLVLSDSTKNAENANQARGKAHAKGREEVIVMNHKSP